MSSNLTTKVLVDYRQFLKLKELAEKGSKSHLEKVEVNTHPEKSEVSEENGEKLNEEAPANNDLIKRPSSEEKVSLKKQKINQRKKRGDWWTI